MSKTHQIIVKADGDGNFTYSPSTLHAKAGDQIGWICETGPFAISFKERTPFYGVSFSSRSDGRQHFIEALRIRGNTIGHHHYAVAVASVRGSGEVDVVLDSGCPDVIVSNDGA